MYDHLNCGFLPSSSYLVPRLSDSVRVQQSLRAHRFSARALAHSLPFFVEKWPPQFCSREFSGPAIHQSRRDRHKIDQSNSFVIWRSIWWQSKYSSSAFVFHKLSINAIDFRSISSLLFRHRIVSLLLLLQCVVHANQLTFHRILRTLYVCVVERREGRTSAVVLLLVSQIPLPRRKVLGGGGTCRRRAW